MNRTTVPQERSTAELARSRAAEAWTDIIGGLRRADVWWLFAGNEIRQRYRRSRIGQFWVTLSLGFLVGGLGLVYSQLFQQSIDLYLPYLAVSLVVWALITGMMVDACTVFQSADSFIRQTPMPLSVYVYRMLARNLIVFAHNMPVAVVVFACFGKLPTVQTLLLVPALALLTLFGLGIGLLLATMAVRFRDLPQAVASVMQIMMFVSPVLFMPEQATGRVGQLVTSLNPFAQLLAVARNPLLGVFDPTPWLAVISMTAGSLLAGFLVFARFRERIVYWL